MQYFCWKFWKLQSNDTCSFEMQRVAVADFDSIDIINIWMEKISPVPTAKCIYPTRDKYATASTWSFGYNFINSWN